MQAAVYKPGTPILSIVDNFPIPEVKPHQVLLKVRACGVCHTDVSLYLSPVDHLSTAPQVFVLSQFADDPRSYIMGHEISGIATKYASSLHFHQLHY